MNQRSLTRDRGSYLISETPQSNVNLILSLFVYQALGLPRLPKSCFNLHTKV